MKHLLWLLLPIIAACSSGQTAPPNDVLVWTHPTQNVDNTPLPLVNIKHTQINWGPSGGPYPNQQIVLAPATTTTVPRANTPGTVCYIATTVDINNQSSSPSNEACLTVLTRPKAPTNLTVN